METRSQRSVLRKIASRRNRARRFGERNDVFTIVSSPAVDSGQARLRASLLGSRLLTRREEQVLRLVARGETDRSIAERLYVSRRTINSHVSNILAKLDVSSRREAVVTAVRLGLL